ncbi:MAG: hypothetical protein Q9219_000114 [cf. Caloplaca sp. 3 TL-2023]
MSPINDSRGIRYGFCVAIAVFAFGRSSAQAIPRQIDLKASRDDTQNTEHGNRYDGEQV